MMSHEYKTVTVWIGLGITHFCLVSGKDLRLGLNTFVMCYLHKYISTTKQRTNKVSTCDTGKSA